jgi:CheY-like chemotaxis protein
MPEGGRIIISAANTDLDPYVAARAGLLRPGAYVRIAVRDNGLGMDATVRSRAFDPFFTTKALGQGTGLGLSMIHGFVHQSGGNVVLSSEPGRGTLVELYLPAAASLLAEDAAAPMEDRADSVAETVLVVEDDPIVRNLIVETLNDMSCHTLEAADGPSGVEILLSDKPIGLLVTDIGLPGLNGRQVADAGRQRRPNLKVLFITGYAETVASSQGFLGSGMAMLTKPFPMETFASKVKEMIPPKSAMH